MQYKSASLPFYIKFTAMTPLDLTYLETMALSFRTDITSPAQRLDVFVSFPSIKFAPVLHGQEGIEDLLFLFGRRARLVPEVNDVVDEWHFSM
jgi:hypothetical protein